MIRVDPMEIRRTRNGDLRWVARRLHCGQNVPVSPDEYEFWPEDSLVEYREEFQHGRWYDISDKVHEFAHSELKRLIGPPRPWWRRWLGLNKTSNPGSAMPVARMLEDRCTSSK